MNVKRKRLTKRNLVTLGAALGSGFLMAFSNNKFTKYLFILISGILFGSMHVIGSVTSVYDYLYIIPYSALGISFAALLYKTDNIFSTITIHSIHNTASIILYFMGGII